MSSIKEIAERICRNNLDSERVSVTQFCDIQAAIEKALREELRFAINLIETEIPVGGGKPFPLETVQPHVKAVLRLLRERAGGEP